MENGKTTFIPPEFLKPQLSTKLYRSSFNYLKRFHSEQIFYEICGELKMPSEYLLSEGNWVSVEFGERFAALVRSKTGDPEIYRKIGHYFLSAENISTFEYTLIKNMSPLLMLKSIQQFSRKSNAVCQMNVTRHSLSSITIDMKADVPVYRDMVLNTMGVTEAFRELYGLNDFKVEVDVKSNEDEQVTGYSLTVSFAAWTYYFRRLRTLGTFLGVGAAVGFFLSKLEFLTHWNFVPMLTGLLLLAGFAIRQLLQTMNTLKSSSEIFDERTRQKNLEIYKKAELLERRYQEATMLKQLTSELVSCRDPRQVIEKTLQACKTNFKYNKAAVFLVSRERQRLSLRASVGFEKLGEKFGALEFVYPNPDARDGFIASVLDRGTTAMVIDVDTYKQHLKPQYAALLEGLNVGSILLSPIQSGDQKYGVLIVVRTKEEETLGPQDRFLVETITSQLSLYFESASNYENETKLRHVFQKYVPKPVLEQILHADYQSSGTLQPQRREICSVFMDLRGFTSASEHLAPEKVFDLVNIFATFATKHLAEAGAIVDNIIGDEIVSFFLEKANSPGEHAARAVQAVQKIVENFAQFERELAGRGFPPLRLGVGLHVGAASIGSVGSDQKMNFTALGKTVNVASRLQSLTRKTMEDKVSVIASKEVLISLGQDHLFHFESEVLRGTTEPTLYLKMPKDILQQVSTVPRASSKRSEVA